MCYYCVRDKKLSERHSRHVIKDQFRGCYELNLRCSDTFVFIHKI